MTRQITIRQPSSVNRRRPLLAQTKNTNSSASVRLAESAGSTVAECAAIWCCCPCAIVNLIVLVVYKVPVGLCRRAWRKKRRQRLIKQGLVSPKGRKHSFRSEDEKELSVLQLDTEFVEVKKTVELEKEAAELDREMLEKFYGTGFGRSPSQREQ